MSTETCQEILNTKNVLVTFFYAKTFREDPKEKVGTEIASVATVFNWLVTWDNLKGTNSNTGSYSLK